MLWSLRSSRISLFNSLSHTSEKTKIYWRDIQRLVVANVANANANIDKLQVDIDLKLTSLRQFPHFMTLHLFYCDITV